MQETESETQSDEREEDMKEMIFQIAKLN